MQSSEQQKTILLPDMQLTNMPTTVANERRDTYVKGQNNFVKLFQILYSYGADLKISSKSRLISLSPAACFHILFLRLD